MKQGFSLAQLFLIGIPVAILSGCGGGGSSTPPPPPPNISVNVLFSGNGTLEAGQQLNLTAQVSGDSSGKGVTWALSPSSGAGTLINVTSTSVTYAAPAMPPASNVGITIIATSVTDPTKSNTAMLELVAISVSLTTPNGQVEGGTSAVITATVSNDLANKGVNPMSWALTNGGAACSPGCGTLSNQTSSSATYNAPATPPANSLNLTITATSVTDPTKSGTAMLELVAISVSLTTPNGQVEAGTSAVITATVSNDLANKGVDPMSWTLTNGGSACSSGCGTLSNQTSSSATYNAPATPPANSLNLTITATSLSDSRQSGTIGITFQAIIVSLTANPGSLQAQGASTITAMVTFDPANQGVGANSWTLTNSAGTACSPGCGTLSNATTTSITYTAPPPPVQSNLAVTITATSISAAQQMGSVSVTVLAITITISPTSALVPVSSGSVPFTGTTANDPATPSMVNWTLLQGGIACAPPNCGSFSSTPTASGTATTYMAPTTLPASPSVSVTATSVTDNTKSAGATITLTNGTVEIVPDELDFGSTKVNNSRSKTIRLTNTGTTALTFSANAFIFSGGPFTQTNTCPANPASLAMSASCQITVSFKPVNPLLYASTLSIADSSADSPQVVKLTGTGIERRGPLDETVVDSLSFNRAPNVPVPTGLSQVGTRVLDLVDTTRIDPYVANGTKRELLVRLWYPAAAAQNCPRAEYTSQRVWDEFSRLVGVSLPRVTTNSCWNLPVADGAHPVVVFTHGYTGTFTDYTFLFEDLASRGYVVASVDHTFEATAVAFPDGRFARGVFGSHMGPDLRADLPAMDFALSVRLSDLKFVVNELELLNAGADVQLAGKLDTSRIALAGHSLGGLAAIRGVEEDPRFRAGIIIDGSVPSLALREIDTPMLILAAGRDTWSEEETSLWNTLRGPRLAVNLRATEHVTPSDLVWLAVGAVKTGSMGPEKTMEAARDYIAAFLDAHLLGKTPDALLAGPSRRYRDAVVTTQKQALHAKH